MPLFDDLLAQPAILISIGLAFLMIIAAVVLAVLPRVKANRARAKRRKVAAQKAFQAEQELLEQEAEAVATLTRKGGKRRATAQAANDEEEAAVPVAKAKAKLTTPSAPVVSGAPPINPGAAALNASLTAGAAAAIKTETKEEVSPEMQDLLSSVFSDEDNSERQAILLKGTEPVAIDELLTLSKAVAAQIRGEQPSNIVRVKETQLS